MHILEILLLLWFIGMPIYTAVTFEKNKQMLIDGRINRTTAYQQTIAFLWVPTLLLAAVAWVTELNTMTLGLVFTGSTTEIGVFALLVILTIYGGVNYLSIKKDAKIRAKYREVFSPMRWILPQTKSELKWFTIGVSSSAGICEELLFRGYLMWLLTPYIGIIGAMVVSSALFGLNHIYQGWSGVLNTSLLGLVFAFVYWLTGSLWTVIVLHLLIDVLAGFQAYLALQDDEDYPQAKNSNSVSTTK